MYIESEIEVPFWLSCMYVHSNKYTVSYRSCPPLLVHSGKVIHSMTAHCDAVTGLAIDPHGLYLLSGSESAWERGAGSWLVAITLLPAHRSCHCICSVYIGLVYRLAVQLTRLLLSWRPFVSAHSGHDGSLRFWNMESKICIQECTAHRFKRFDESIFNVACHSTKPYFASAGADGISKVFV